MASNYNSRLKPAEVLLINGKDHLITKRQSFEDLIANQTLVELT
jgi:diaminopimelate decarboxylase